MGGKERAVRIDRGTPFGNPFILGPDGDRDAVCDARRDHYLPHKPSIHKQLADLKGKVLTCHCYPERCHGESLIWPPKNFCNGRTRALGAQGTVTASADKFPLNDRVLIVS